MQSTRVVVLIVAVAFACVFCQASSVATKQSHPRHTILNLVRAASELAQSYSEDQSNQKAIQNQLLYPLGTQQDNFEVSLSEKPPLEAAQHNARLSQMSSSESQSSPAHQYSARPSWTKRSTDAHSQDGQEEVLGSVQQVASSISQNFLRNARATTRPYDVPQIECPPADDQMERFPCPSPDTLGRYRCIDDHVLCDGFIDCPDGEDEDRQQCMFYKTTKAHLDVIADAIIRFIRGRK